MKILTAAYYEFVKNIRDIRMAAILLVFPIITVYILGNAVGNFFSTDVVNKIPVGYVNEDSGLIGEEFDEFVKQQEISDRLEIINYDDKDLAEGDIDNGKIDVMIYLPNNLSEEILKENNQSIELYGKKNIEFVESLTNSFISTYNTLNAVISVSGRPVLPNSEGSIKRIFYTKDAKMPTMVDYYSVLTLLQVLIIGAIFGVFIVTRGTDTDMHIRIHSLPVSRWALIIGRILGSTVYLLLSAIVVILFTKYVYQANWDGNLLIILGTLTIFSIMAVGIGALIGSLIPSFSTSLMIVLLLMIFFGTISGAVSPASTGGIGIISPNFHAKILIFGTIYGYSKDIMKEAALLLIGGTMVIYSMLAIFIGRTKYDNI